MALALALLAPGCGGDDEVRTVPLEGRPSAVALTPAGLWVTSDQAAADPATGGALRLLDPASGAVRASWRLPAHPVALEPVGDGVWVVGAGGVVGRVASADPSTPVEQTTLGGTPVDAVAVGDRVYVGDLERGVVHVLDAATGEVAGPAFAVPAGVVRLAEGDGRLWVTGLEREVTPIDLATGAVGSPVEVGDGPIGLVVHDGVVWVTASDAGTVHRIDAATARPAGPPVATGTAPIAVAVDGAGLLWVVNQDDASVVALDPATGERRSDPVPIRGRARGLAPSPDGGAWVVGTDPPLAVLVPPP